MQPEQLQRVESDLAAVRAALGDEYPFDRSHVAMHLLAAAAGALILGMTAGGLEPYVRVVIPVYAAFMALAWSFQIRHLRSRRAEAPSLWRVGRKEVVGSLVASVLLVGYVVWVSTLARQEGRWDQPAKNEMASSVFYFLGTFVAACVAANRLHWPALGWAAALALGGLALPLCEGREQFSLALGGAILAGGGVSGVLLWLQLRSREVRRAD